MRVKPSSNAITITFTILIFSAHFLITNNVYYLIPATITLTYLLVQYLLAIEAIGRKAREIIGIRGPLEVELPLGISSFKITFKNKLKNPLYVELRGVKVNREGLFIKLAEKNFTLKDKRAVKVKLMAEYQGEYSIEKLKIRLYTANLLFYTERTIKLKTKIKVHPRTYLLVMRILAGQGLYATTTGTFTQRIVRVGWDYYGTREHVPGDELRFIDWKATARFQKLMIKEFLEESSGSLAVILDLTNSRLSDMGLDRLAEITALLINSCHKQRVPVLLALWAGEKFDRVIGPTLKAHEVNQMYLSVLNVFYRKRTTIPDLEVLPTYYFYLIADVINEERASKLRQVYELAREKSLKLRTDLSAFSETIVTIVTDLSSPLENLIEMLKVNRVRRIIIIVPYPYWRDLKNIKAREIAKEYFNKRLNELIKLEAQVLVGEPEKIVRTIRRSLL